MPDEDVNVLYDGPPIRTHRAAWLLLGAGGLVMVPIGLINRAWWLPILAVPLLLAGLILLQTHLRIVVDHDTAIVRVTNFWLGLRLRRRQYPLSNVSSFGLHRVAGAERQRPSDTWYLRLQIHTTARTFFGGVKPHMRTYLVGKYDSRLRALEARHELGEMLQAGSQG
jgi:hypothetical protein